jgi:hypothetical protein
MPNVTEKMRKIMAYCPDGYSVNEGQTVDMLGKTELWRIYESHSEPDLTRIPQDLVDTPFGHAKRIPKEWGPCLYYKVV